MSGQCASDSTGEPAPAVMRWASIRPWMVPTSPSPSSAWRLTTAGVALNVTVPEPMRVRSTLRLASRCAISASVSSARSVPASGVVAPPESRASALTVPRYSIPGVMPAVSALSGSWLLMTVVDQAAGLQPASAHRLPGVPVRHSHSMRI